MKTTWRPLFNRENQIWKYPTKKEWRHRKNSIFCLFSPILGAKWPKISQNHNMWYHFFYRKIVTNTMVTLILPHLNMKKSTFKGSPLWNSTRTHCVTSHKIGTRDFFKFGQNRKSSPYGVQKNKNRPWYIFLILKQVQSHRVLWQSCQTEKVWFLLLSIVSNV